MGSYFSYLNLRPDEDFLRNQLGRELDKLMTLDVNLTGRAHHLYSLASRSGNAPPLSTSLASALLEAVGSHEICLLVTGCSVRPDIDPAIGEPDGPPGAAALALALHMGRSGLAIVVTAAPLAGQVAAAFRAVGASIVDVETLLRLREKPARLFAVSIVELECDRDLTGAFERLLEQSRPRAIVAIEHFGVAADGHAYLSTGKPVSGALLRTDPLFRLAAARSLVRGCCVDNPNEAGTARLHSERALHPAMDDDFEHVVVGASANWAAYAVSAALAALSGQAEAAFDKRLDEASVAATLQSGAIDPFSGLADPMLGIDTVERPFHGYVTDLMARTARGYRDAIDFARRSAAGEL